MKSIPSSLDKGFKMEPRVIKSENEYKMALAEVERLIALDPEPGTPDAKSLDLFAMLVEAYEKKRFSITLPSPVEAILFRMEEQGLMQKDLVPYIGSKSKVSEVLSRKRPLTIQMIRELHAGLNIPLEVLLQVTKDQVNEVVEIDWQRFPILEIVKRGWVTSQFSNARAHATELMQAFLAPLSGQLPKAAICRRTWSKLSEKDDEMYALIAWTTRVIIRAGQECCTSEYKVGTVTKDFLKEVARLSWFDKGPLLAQEFLAKNGIALIIEPHLPKTKLDGGAMLGEEGPIIGLTLRLDRIDNFWFTLLHELVHVAEHLKNIDNAFIDNEIEKESDEDPKENKANKLAREAFIPRTTWSRSDAFRQRTPDSINKLAGELRIHPAIIAGRIRHETNIYSNQSINNLLGQGEVKRLFSNVK